MVMSERWSYFTLRKRENCIPQFKQATEDRLISANELPYFEGDFWPNVLEESIKELEQEEEERKKEENTAASGHWMRLILRS